MEGRLHIHGGVLLENFDAGNMIMMDRSAWHSVSRYAHKQERKVLVFAV